MARRSDPIATTVAEPLSSDPDAPVAWTAPEVSVRRGDHIGRYVVDGVIGRGGMGVVLEAFDPELQRRVALKLVRRGRGASSERLLEEARAVARLAHPNVVAVHDVGVHEGDVFLAMEHVQGADVRAWLEGGRTLDAVLDVFLQAGEGLAAAHRNGLVHGDVKPENVLVGHDGRVRVVDFGLARPAYGDAPSGALRAGTPPYMAPEQKSGTDYDGRADQYAFCVSLHSAVTGRIPGAGHPPVQPDPAVPTWLADVLLRGTATDPARRFPSMEALLVELRAGLDPRRGAFREAAEARWAGVWDSGTAARVHRAFEASGSPDADDRWVRVRTLVDARVARWVRTWVEACAATHLDGAQSAVLLDLRIARLERLRDETAALIAVLSEDLDAPALERAWDAVRRLSSIEEPSDPAALQAEAPPQDPARAAEARSLRARLDRARARVDLGRYAEVRDDLTSLLVEIRALDHAPLVADACHLVGRVESEAYDIEAAERAFYDGALAASRARNDALAGNCLAMLVYVVGCRRAEPARAIEIGRIARVVAARIPDDHEVHASLANNLGICHLIAGQFQDGIRELTYAAERWLAAGPEHDIDRTGPLQNLSIAASEMGDLNRALEGLREVARIRATASGEEHPQTARALGNIAETLAILGQFDEADRHARRALAIWEKTVSAGSQQAMYAWVTLARTAIWRGDVEALDLAERALTLRERWEPDSAIVGVTRSLRALARAVTGDLDGARADAEASLERVLRLGPDNRFVGVVLGVVGRVRVLRGEDELAREALERSVAILEKAGGRGNWALLEPLTDLAHVEPVPAKAAALLDQAQAIVSAQGIVGPIASAIAAERVRRGG